MRFTEVGARRGIASFYRSVTLRKLNDLAGDRPCDGPHVSVALVSTAHAGLSAREVLVASFAFLSEERRNGG